MLLIDLLHQIGVAGAQVDQLVARLVQVPLQLLNDNLYDFLVDRLHLLQQVKSVVTAHRVVLEDVIDHLDFLVDPAVHKGTNAPHPLQLDAKLE